VHAWGAWCSPGTYSKASRIPMLAAALRLQQQPSLQAGSVRVMVFVSSADTAKADFLRHSIAVRDTRQMGAATVKVSASTWACLLSYGSLFIDPGHTTKVTIYLVSLSDMPLEIWFTGHASHSEIVDGQTCHLAERS
jgi:hypothetical protein